MMRPRTIAATVAAIATPALAQHITDQTLIDEAAAGVPLWEHGWFGHEVAWLDDLDGNGVPDLAVGAHAEDARHGAVYILLLDASGGVIGTHRIDAGIVDYDLGTPAFGNALATIHDVDGDGIRELAASAPKADEGRVFILFLNPDGTLRDHHVIGHQQGGFGSLDLADGFGEWLSSVGDFTGDGRPELAVGAIGDDAGGESYGAIYLLSLDGRGEVDRSWKYSAADAPLGAMLERYDRFGLSVDSAGDLDGDGIDELAVGLWHDTQADRGLGGLFLLYLDHDLELRDAIRLTDAVPADSEQFGFAVAPAGDLDRDGTPDFFATGPGHAVDDRHVGAVWALLMRANGVVHDYVVIAEGLAGFTGPVPEPSGFGATVSSPFDTDGDGREEFAVGAPLHPNDQGEDTGAVWILELARGCFADRNADGAIDSADFFTFLDEFAVAHPSADLTGDGDHNAADFFHFLDLFTTPCD